MNLVTGATGHIGNVLVRELLARGERVRALILRGEDTSALNGLDIERIDGDILDPVSLPYAMRGVDTVFHLAGIISIMPGANEMMHRVNVTGTANVARAAREAGVRRMVYTSSIHAIRRLPHGACIDEEAGFDPDNPAGEYDCSKARASLALLEEVDRGLDAVLVCPTGVVGPHDYRRSELGTLVRSWMRRRPHVYVDGWFDWVDVRDIAEGLILAAKKGRKGQTYILGGNNVHLKEMYATVRKAAGTRAPAVRLPMRLVLFLAPLTQLWSRITRTKPQFTSYSLETVRSNSSISIEKARTELGYAPRPFPETVADTVAWWQMHEAERAVARRTRKPAVSVPAGSPQTARIALVTGASSGIGAAAARDLARMGYLVVLTARREDRLSTIAEEIRREGGKADYVAADLSRAEGPESLQRFIEEKYGAIDVLVNNAGFGWYGYAEMMPAAMARDMIQVNVSSLLQLILRFLPGMKKRRKGSIINISSVAGSIPSQGVAVYSATKSFIDSLTTALHRELRGTGVHVSAVRPGPVTTEFYNTAAALPSGGRVPAERFGVPASAVSRAILGLLRRPRRVAYVPRGLRIVPWIEAGFGWLMNLIGPVLLRKRALAGARQR